MPGPVSRTETWNAPLFASALMATSPASVNLIALPTRLIRTCVKRRPSPRPLDFEPKFLVGRQRLKRAANGLRDILNAVIRQFEYQLAGFDLRQVEHVIDQAQQVFAVGLKAFEYAEHLLGWLAVSAVRHQFGVAQDGVERRAQLVAHIG